MTGGIKIYGQGAMGLKTHAELLESLADTLDLPSEALAGAAKVTATAGKRLLIENHRGLLEYSAERIVVATEREKLQISGSDLHLLGMNRRELLIGGTLQLLEWM